MSITDELRTYAVMFERVVTAHLNAIADRIDEEHDREVADARNDAPHRAIDKDMAEHGWVQLPNDADGKIIHVGDELTDGKHAYTVTSITFNSCNVVVYGCTETNKSEWPIDQTSKMHHVEHVTVEDVLRDVVTLCHNTWKEEKSVLKFYDVDDVMNSGNIADAADRIREAVAHEEDE